MPSSPEFISSHPAHMSPACMPHIHVVHPLCTDSILTHAHNSVYLTHVWQTPVTTALGPSLFCLLRRQQRGPPSFSSCLNMNDRTVFTHLFLTSRTCLPHAFLSTLVTAPQRFVAFGANTSLPLISTSALPFPVATHRPRLLHTHDKVTHYSLRSLLVQYSSTVRV
jgi:hypothetical protein